MRKEVSVSGSEHYQVEFPLLSARTRALQCEEEVGNKGMWGAKKTERHPPGESIPISLDSPLPPLAGSVELGAERGCRTMTDAWCGGPPSPPRQGTL